MKRAVYTMLSVVFKLLGEIVYGHHLSTETINSLLSRV